MTVAKHPKDPSPSSPPPAGVAQGRPPTFEERLEALEAVVQDLEGEDLPLETSLRRYREGVEHLKACRALLDDAERRLAELVAEPERGGEVRVAERPLEVNDRGLVPAEGLGSPKGERPSKEEKPGNHAKRPAASCDEIPF
jgi:exodeoxyribonuclease VII small subunit